ncbi:MAG: type I methionyl aminopeptidase [Spirochaetales bacterium]|nr:type I methionyl aminopeptidase [Spirochaetales bacterium]
MIPIDNNITLKTSIDIARIRRSCRIVEKTLRFLKDYIQPGISTLDLNSIAEKYIIDNGAIPALKGFKGFPAAICTSVNNVIAHGKPNNYKLEDGDIITIDTTVSIDGWFGDGAWTYFVGSSNPDKERLLKAAWQANLMGISRAKAGYFTGDIGNIITKTAEMLGCSIAEEYAGHGIGKRIHEDPIIPNIGEKNTGIRIVPGMVFTVEPMLSLGSSNIAKMNDGWTLVTDDGSLSAQFEHTVAVFRDYTEVLTFSSGKITDYIDFPPFF